MMPLVYDSVICLSGSNLCLDTEDNLEDPSHFLPHGHCD